MPYQSSHKGFTLIELLVVIAIIGILASVVLASLSEVRAGARDSFRLQSLRSLQTSLELFYVQNGEYPTTGGEWRGGLVNCYGGHGFGATGYIPGLVPDYIPVLPAEPRPQWNSACFMYRSNGTDYKVMAHGTYENCDAGSCPLQDPHRTNQRTGAVYSSGGAGF